LREVRRERRYATLAESAFPVLATDLAAVSPASIAGDGVVAGLGLGRWVTVLLLFLLLSGGAVVSQDALAGEKERGTLETLLSTAASRGEIITGKVLLVFSVALAITVVQVANLLVYVGLGLIPASSDLAAAITPALAAGLLVFVLPLAALVAALLVLISGRAQSYREAQLYLFPLLLLCGVPAAAASLPEISLRSAIVLVPIANISIGVKEMLVGRVDWLMLPLAWLVTAATAGYAMVAATRALSTERLIVPSSIDSAAVRAGGVRVGQVATWFAVMWAILLVVSLNLGEQTDIRLQLLVNLVVVFLGGSLLFIRRFKLDPRAVLSLNAPHPLAWLAVLVGTPAALVTGIGVFRLSQLFLPVPREMLESFSQYLVPESVPFWQLLPMMTILPGICEEIAFRGVLLHALKRHYPAVAAALLVGIVFGLFHFSLFRILPTAYLGVVLAAVTLLSGSIYPAMAWHALNNALGLLAGHYKVDLEKLPAAEYVWAAIALVLALVLLWRTRPPASAARTERLRTRPARPVLPPRTRPDSDT
jgi:membrane protease YdiL (CAAX protease family)/ABC-type transport system involved in multi-copper enzyme maturation permease subunit